MEKKYHSCEHCKNYNEMKIVEIVGNIKSESVKIDFICEKNKQYCTHVKNPKKCPDFVQKKNISVCELILEK